MRSASIDHLTLRIPADRIDEFVSLYRDALGFELEHIEAYRSGDTGFFFVRLAEEIVLHISPTDSFLPPDGDGFNHVALFVDEPRTDVRDRLEDAGVAIVDEATRLGVTGRDPSIYSKIRSAISSRSNRPSSLTDARVPIQFARHDPMEIRSMQSGAFHTAYFGSARPFEQ